MNQIFQEEGYNDTHLKQIDFIIENKILIRRMNIDIKRSSKEEMKNNVIGKRKSIKI